MIEKIETIIIRNLVCYNLVNEDEIEIYKFGIECFVLKVIHYFTYCIIALFCGCLYEFVFFIISYIALRKYAGGIHANTRIGCLVISNFILSGVLILGHKIEKSVLLYILSVLSFLVIVLFAPVDNPNRILSNAERKRFKKIAILVCLLELVVSFAGYKFEYLKWVQFGVIIGAFMTILGKIKYSGL